MVTSQFSNFRGSTMPEAFQNAILLQVGPPDVTSMDFVELDFSDVFGPIPAQAHVEFSCIKPKKLVAPPDTKEVSNNDPEAFYSCSHSLAGSTTVVCQRMKLRKPTLEETTDSLELVEGAATEGLEKLEILSLDIASLGISSGQIDDNPPTNGSVGLEDFEVLKVVGQGAFGKVYQVRKRGSLEIFAMKVVRKDRIMEKNHAEYMLTEREILAKVDHPFIVKLRYSFQTKYRLYLVLDFINGGHLFFQLNHQGLFREDLARLYAAEIVSAVSHLHSNGIMHRDLKPENILLDADGHVMLTDFGLAKEFDENTRSNSMCGTLDYMAPEIVLRKGHVKAADWWSMGILLYEMLTGKPPFAGGNRQKIQQKIIKDKIKLPAYLSSEAHSLLKGLLQKEASKRLGSGLGGSEEIKSHKWFRSINWKKLEAREVQPSFLPEVSGELCVANFEECWTKMSVLDSPAASPKISENPFKGFSYVRPAAPLLQ